MADKVVIKPWEVHGEGREFENISNDFGRAALDLENRLAGLGTPWGADEPGTGFGHAYGEAREGVLGGLQGLSERLRKIGAGLHTMADNAERNDGDVRADFSGLEAGLPNGGGTGHRPTAV
ncbi:WXG100 family type VII secretion target [Kitasatospora camelliae]|uniref:Excreted virulence factor EspC (Type VII ESX diderm) n=1 Tax=Kitasatospora camelliae TaxID=3156397 RepID=A0AAU8JV92_9ACTN